MKQKNLLVVFCLIFSILFSSPVCALKYVRQAATGNGSGSDWTNAYTALPPTLTRSETYYIASGSYPNYNIDDPVATNGALITIKKATDDVHGTDTGWVRNSTTHGLGQAIFSGLTVETDGENYSAGDLMIDGSYEYGFKVTFGDGGVGIYLRGSNYTEKNKWNKNITLKYTEVAGPAGSSPYAYQNSSRGIWLYAAPNMTISHCSVHGSDTLIEGLDMDGSTIEYTKLFDSACTGSRCACCAHENVLIAPGSDNITFRYNEIYNWQAEGVYPGYSGSVWRVYGNIFRDPIGGRAFEPHQYSSAQGPGRAQYSDFAIYNNVFVNVGNSINLRGEYADPVKIYNNIFYNSGSPGISSQDGYGTMLKDNNWYSGSSNGSEANGVAGAGANPFVNLAAKNYRISSTIANNLPRNKGADLTALGIEQKIEYNNKDADNNTRGLDGSWDVGAYEYSTSTSNPSTPAAPQNLRVN